MMKMLLLIFGILLTSGGYLYYQSETLTNTENEPVVFNEVYEQATLTPTPKEPSERALRASIGVFLLVNGELEQSYLDKYSKNNDIEEAIKNFALSLDSDSSKLVEVENIIASVDNSGSYSSYNYDSSNDYTYGNEVSDNSYGGSGGSSYGSNTSNYYNSDSTIGNDSNELNIVGGSSSYRQVGNTLYGSEGDSYRRIGNSVYGSDGSSYRQIGNTVYGDDGSSYREIGNTVYGSDGTSYRQIGNTTYGSDGSTARQIGNTTYLDW